MVIANNDSRTRISLLDSLRRGETDQAWLIFIEKYSKMISSWCHRWGASVEDTEDIVQETLLVVFRKIAEFQYDPSLSFRAWLKTVSYHKWLQAVEHNRLVYPPVQDPSIVTTYKSRVNLAVEEFKQLLDRIAEQEIFSLACTKVRSRVSERVWLCFEQSELNPIHPENRTFCFSKIWYSAKPVQNRLLAYRRIKDGPA